MKARINYCSVTVRRLSEVLSAIPMQIYCYGVIPLREKAQSLNIDMAFWDTRLGGTHSLQKLRGNAKSPGACRE